MLLVLLHSWTVILNNKYSIVYIFFVFFYIVLIVSLIHADLPGFSVNNRPGLGIKPIPFGGSGPAQLDVTLILKILGERHGGPHQQTAKNSTSQAAQEIQPTAFLHRHQHIQFNIGENSPYRLAGIIG